MLIHIESPLLVKRETTLLIIEQTLIYN